MSAWNFANNATSLGFTTSGMSGFSGVNCFGGPTNLYINNAYNTSYYANGGFQLSFGATRGLVTQERIGTSNVSTTAKTRIIDNGDSIRLSTQGVTGTFTAQFLHPSNFYIYNHGMQFPTYTTITVYIYNGIIYGWYDSTGTNVVSTWPGVGIIDNGTSLRCVAGLTGTLSYYTMYDCWMYNPQYDQYNVLRMISSINIFYNQITIVLSSGLIQSITATSNNFWNYNVY